METQSLLHQIRELVTQFPVMLERVQSNLNTLQLLKVMYLDTSSYLDKSRAFITFASNDSSILFVHLRIQSV